MKYKAVISYDGTNYYGYASQPSLVTIQSEIEKVLSLICDTPIKIYASGRTDRYVHAIGQVIDFELPIAFDSDILKNKLNRMLPKDIRIISVKRVKNSFSSRFSATKKTYIYVINHAEPTPFFRNYECSLSNLDFEKIEKAMPLFVGKHCFMNFTSKEEDEKDFLREIYSFKIVRKHNKYIFEITGDGFMRYMVRKIIGTLIEVGKGKIDEEFIKQNLSSTERKIVTYTAEPQALYLKRVFYR